MRRRIWTEHLPPGELGSAPLMALLERFSLEPLVALPPSRETPQMARALAALSARGLRVGLWPLLSDEEGYWASEDNAEAFVARVAQARRFATEAGAPPRTIAVDLEPALATMRTFLESTMISRGMIGARRMLGALGAERRAKRRAATARYAEMVRRLEAEGVEVLAAVLPPAVIDLRAGAAVWQAGLQTPVSGVPWSRVSPMLYSTMIASLLPSGSLDSARAIIHVHARMLVEASGPERASVSLGLVAPGKLGNEPHFFDPEALVADVAAARHAGVDDLALFSLEGVLARGAPDPWLSAFVRTEAGLPPGPRRGAVSAAVRTVAAVQSLGRWWPG